jgi:cytochrome P450
LASTRTRFPLGAAVTLASLDADPYAILAQLREREAVSWLPVLDGWLVTRRDLCIEVMRDAARFTVDDPRFSTAQVVGPSMLSLDGAEHRRHRDPFAKAFLGPDARARFAERVEVEARRLVSTLTPLGRAEIRRDLAGPLAVNVVAAALELGDTPPSVVLGWYDEIVAAVDRVSTGGRVGPAAREAVGELGRHVAGSVEDGGGMLAGATVALTTPEIVSNAAVMMFGGIETTEGMIANLIYHLLTFVGGPVEASLYANAVEESLRLEPAAAVIDRYATRDVELDAGLIHEGDFVEISLAGANRDPSFFPDPDRFDVRRENARHHVTFAHGPHVCVGMHLARLETQTAVERLFARLPRLRLDPERPTAPRGLVFRKPPTLDVLW